MDTQWRFAGMGGACGLDYGPLIAAAPVFCVAIDREFFRKVKIYEAEALKIMNGKAPICDEKKKALCAAQFGEFLEGACKQCKEMSDG